MTAAGGAYARRAFKETTSPQKQLYFFYSEINLIVMSVLRGSRIRVVCRDRRKRGVR